MVDGPRRLKERHLKMSLRQHGRTFRAMAWNAVEKEPVIAGANGALDIAYSLEQNEFNGNTYTELRLSDARRPAVIAGRPERRRRPRLPWTRAVMTSWQRRARLVAAVVAIAVAGGAYWMTGARRTVPPPPPVTPLEPTVTAKMQRRRSGAVERRARGLRPRLQASR